MYRFEVSRIGDCKVGSTVGIHQIKRRLTIQLDLKEIFASLAKPSRRIQDLRVHLRGSDDGHHLSLTGTSRSARTGSSDGVGEEILSSCRIGENLVDDRPGARLWYPHTIRERIHYPGEGRPRYRTGQRNIQRAAIANFLRRGYDRRVRQGIHNDINDQRGTETVAGFGCNGITNRPRGGSRIL